MKDTETPFPTLAKGDHISYVGPDFPQLAKDTFLVEEVHGPLTTVASTTDDSRIWVLRTEHLRKTSGVTPDKDAVDVANLLKDL